MKNAVFLLLCAFLFVSSPSFSQINTGAERTNLYFPLIKHKSIAVVANNASQIAGKNVVDSLHAAGFEIKRILSPEHGFRMFFGAGTTVKNSIDSATGIPVVSLYGKKKKPEKSDFKGVDMVVFDLQDVGVRFFTYISTLTYVMEACAENNTPLLVLDRPNPNGFFIDGPCLDSSQASFVGLHPIPIVYGMTIGEYAQMVNGEGWLKNGVICELNVIPLEGYSHASRYLLPVRPSPNLPTMEAVYLYPSLCLFEGTIMSVGRGTEFPFQVFGHPNMKGFSFSFIPVRMPGVNDDPLFKGEECRGVDLRKFYAERPKMMGRINLSWLKMGFKDLGSKPEFFTAYFDKLAGTKELKQQILQDLPESEIRKSWEPGLEAFKKIRVKYLIYPD